MSESCLIQDSPTYGVLDNRGAEVKLWTGDVQSPGTLVGCQACPPHVAACRVAPQIIDYSVNQKLKYMFGHLVCVLT